MCLRKQASPRQFTSWMTTNTDTDDIGKVEQDGPTPSLIISSLKIKPEIYIASKIERSIDSKAAWQIQEWVEKHETRIYLVYLILCEIWW